MNAFGQSLHQSGDADLVDHFRELAGPGGTEKPAHARVGSNHLLGASIRLGIATAHDGEHAVLGAGLAAGDGRIDETEAALLRLRVELAGDFRGGRCVVDEHGAALDAVEGAIRAKRHLAQIVIVANAAHDEVLALGRGFGCRCAAPAVLCNPFLRLGRGAVVDGDVVATLVLEMPCHGVPNDAETEKSHLRHPVLLEHCHAAARIPICGRDCDGAAPASTIIALTGPVCPLWCPSQREACGGEPWMAVSKEQVLAALEGVQSPTGAPLPGTGALSDVVASDGKVFLSITVDAAEVKAWDPVRKRAEEVVRALPGVQSALVALTAERRAGAASARPPH